MGLCHIPDMFQEKMNKLFNGLEYIRPYIDDLLIIRNKYFEEHSNELDKVLSKLKTKDFKVNAGKYFFAKNELEKRITRQGTIPLPD